MNTTLKHPQGKRTDFLNSMKGLMIALMLTLTVSASYAQTTADWYVDVNAASGGSGDSWASAYDNLQTAITNGETGDVIFVKKGEYLLTAAITPKEGMEIYGSFTGTEITLAERDLSNFSNDASNATILKSNGNQRVITINYPPVDPSPNILDGLVITGGGNVSMGGGIYVLNASPTLRNLIITDNTASGSNGSGYQNGSNGHGGGIYIVGDCAPNLTNVVFSKNTAKGGNGGNSEGEPYAGGDGGNGYGGGMYSGNTSAPSLTNVTFMDNSSNGGLAGTGALFNGDIGNGYGGGMYNANSSAPSLTNVTLSRNIADGATSYGGGIYNEAAPQPKLYNTILLGNTATINPGIHNESALPDIQYSLIQGETGGSNGNLDGTAYNEADVFADPDNGDYTLKNTSPAINAGSNDLYTNVGGNLASDADAAGKLRLYDGTPATDMIDMGAYELQRDPIAPISPDANNIIYVNKSVSGGDQSGNSWANAIPELADALVRTNSYYDNAWETTPLKIYVAKGTYKPLYSPEDGANFGTDQGRNNSFSMVKNVQLYGGFDPANGIEDLTDTRILPSSDEAVGTILSGDIGTENETSDNIYNVLVSAGDLGSASLDGFSITGGNANAYSDLYVNGKQIFKCSGAGVYNSVSSPTYKHVILHNNSCTESGGGMFSYMSSPALQLVIMKNNQAKDGGGMTNQESSSPTLLNVSIESNQASEKGSGMYNVDESEPTLTNVSIVGNEASVSSEEVPSCVSQNSSLTLNNCIIWDVVTGDYTAQNSLIKGTSDTSNGNLDATDLTDTDIFTDPANGDYSLKITSIAVNSGSNTLYTDAGGDLANDVDLAGNPRLYDGVPSTDIIDMGAYEYLDNIDPVFTSATTASFIENETGTVYTVTATDANTITYSLGSGNDKALFEIVASTGVVTFKATPDFENPTDADTDNAYVINVIASDGINTVNQDVTITVTDVDDTDPVFISATIVDFVENGTGTAYTVTATDANALTYSLGSSNDESLFDIVASTGVVTFKTAPDFESPTDDNQDNAYVINVIVSDEINSANQNVTITVTDVDEITPSVTISSAATTPVSAAFDVSIAFSEEVTGFAIEDLTLSNAEASGFSGTGDTYSVTLTPLANGTVTMVIAAGSAGDAAGNGNSEGTFSIEANLAVPLSIENDLGGDQLLIYPNPSSQYIRIRSDRSVHIYSLLDIKGRLLKQIETTDQVIAIDDLEAGIYFIHALGERSTMTKFIKK